MPEIGIVILAAGGSSRLGSPKQLLRFMGASLLRRAAETALRTPYRPIVVVLGASGEACAAEIADLNVEIAMCAEWAAGMGASIRAGLLAATARAPLDAVLLMLCDQPHLDPEILTNLADAYTATAKPIVACEYAGTFGVPALFDQTMFAELHDLPGEQGAKKLIARYRERVATLPFPGGALDIDVPAEAAALGALQRDPGENRGGEFRSGSGAAARGLR